MPVTLTSSIAHVVWGIASEEIRALPIINAPADAVEIRCTYEPKAFARAVVKTPTGEREFILSKTPVGLALAWEQRDTRTSQSLPLWWTLLRYAEHLLGRRP